MTKQEFLLKYKLRDELAYIFGELTLSINLNTRLNIGSLEEQVSSIKTQFNEQLDNFLEDYKTVDWKIDN